MMLTDERVAKALGWKMVIIEGVMWRVHPNGSHETCRDTCRIPKFTTDLNAITGAIEGLGLWWTMTRETSKGWALADVGEFLKRSGDHKADTPCLALCAALLAYLKEKKNAD